MNIQAAIDRLNKLHENIRTIPEVVDWVVFNNQKELLSLNRDQMLLGRNTEGQELAPDYLSDPYFKSPEHAQAYAKHKYTLEARHRERLTHILNYPEKGKNTPNLIVTGVFQDAMFIDISSKSFTIGSTYIDSDDIERKYNGKVFGLAPLSKEYFYLNYIRPNIIKHLRR